MLDIGFRNTKLEKLCNDAILMQRKLGAQDARVLMMRLGVLKNAICLDDVPKTPPERCHELDHDRKGEFAVDLAHPKRLVFVPNHDPVPLKEDGGIDLKKVTAITIIEIIDYH